MIQSVNKFKANILNKKGKEIWRYYKTIAGAKRGQQRAEERALPSIVWEKINGKWEAIDSRNSRRST